MPRAKTRLTPDEQWTSTVRYATRIHPDDTAFSWAGWQQRYIEFCPLLGRTPASESDQRELWQAERHGRQVISNRGRSSACIVVVTRAHRWLDVGDVLHLQGVNGMNERFAVTGVSSKGTRLRYCHLRLDHGTGQGFIETFRVPDSLIGLRWDDEAAREFAHQCREQVIERRRR